MKSGSWMFSNCFHSDHESSKNRCRIFSYEKKYFDSSTFQTSVKIYQPYLPTLCQNLSKPRNLHGKSTQAAWETNRTAPAMETLAVGFQRFGPESNNRIIEEYVIFLWVSYEYIEICRILMRYVSKMRILANCVTILKSVPMTWMFDDLGYSDAVKLW